MLKGFGQFATGTVQVCHRSPDACGLTATDCRNPHLAAPRLPSLALSPVGASLLAIFSALRRRGSPASWLLQQRDPRLVHDVRVRAVRSRYGAVLPSIARCLLRPNSDRLQKSAARGATITSRGLSPVGASLLAIFSAPPRRGSPASWLLQQRDPRLVHDVRVRAVRYRYGAGLPSVARCFSGLTPTDCRRRIRAAPAVPLRTSNAYATTRVHYLRRGRSALWWVWEQPFLTPSSSHCTVPSWRVAVAE